MYVICNKKRYITHFIRVQVSNKLCSDRSSGRRPSSPKERGRAMCYNTVLAFCKERHEYSAFCPSRM